MIVCWLTLQTAAASPVVNTRFSAQFCDLEVDPETGKVTILRFVAAQDVGRAIHPGYVEGQIQGGVVQGIGWALNEEYIYDEHGRLEFRCRHERQLLGGECGHGNIGFHLIEANIQELLRTPRTDEASWC